MYNFKLFSKGFNQKQDATVSTICTLLD